MKMQKLVNYGIKAIKKYEMIEDGDHIAVGISGGKDSLTLLHLLNHLKRYMGFNIEIEAITIDCFKNSDFSVLEEHIASLGIRYTVHRTDIGHIVFNERKETNPCSLCSKMRKGALNDIALSLGCNKVALGHTKDDLIQTLFMSLFFEGRLHTFPCNYYLDRTKLYFIRPLVYVPEKDIKGFLNKYDLHKYVIESTCPANGNTQREEMKNFIKELRGKYIDIDDKILGAIERSGLDGYKKD